MSAKILKDYDYSKILTSNNRIILSSNLGQINFQQIVPSGDAPPGEDWLNWRNYENEPKFGFKEVRRNHYLPDLVYGVQLPLIDGRIEKPFQNIIGDFTQGYFDFKNTLSMHIDLFDGNYNGGPLKTIHKAGFQELRKYYYGPTMALTRFLRAGDIVDVSVSGQFNDYDLAWWLAPDSNNFFGGSWFSGSIQVFGLGIISLNGGVSIPLTNTVDRSRTIPIWGNWITTPPTVLSTDIANAKFTAPKDMFGFFILHYYQSIDFGINQYLDVSLTITPAP